MAFSKLRAIALAVVSLLEILLFGGLQTGWFSILFTLKQDKVFEDLCDFSRNNFSGNASDDISNENTGCFSQDEKLNLIFSIGIAILALTTVIHGQLYFKFRVRTVRIFTMCEMVAGLLFIGFTSAENPWLPLPGIIFIGVAGVSLLLCNMQVAVFLKTWSSVYIGLMNGCYDSSVVTVMVVKILYEKGVRRLISYIGVAVVFILVAGIGTILHNNPSKNVQENQKDDTAGEISTDLNDSSDLEKSKALNKQQTPPCENSFYSRSVIIRSRLFVSHIIWFSIVQLRYFYFLGSANRLFGQVLGHADVEVSYFTDVMTYTMLGGVLSSFLAGYLLKVQNKWFTGSMKTMIPLIVTSFLAVLLSCITLVPTRDAFYADFIVLTLLRSFIYSTNMVFFLSAFPSKYSSFLVALAISVSGVITLTQYALFTWTELYESATTHVNSVLLLLCSISLFHPVLIYVDYRRALRKIQQRNDTS